MNNVKSGSISNYIFFLIFERRRKKLIATTNVLLPWLQMRYKRNFRFNFWLLKLTRIFFFFFSRLQIICILLPHVFLLLLLLLIFLFLLFFSSFFIHTQLCSLWAYHVSVCNFEAKFRNTRQRKRERESESEKEN